MQNSKNFKVNRSSAGSGKTYTLSLNFIALSLIGSVKYSTEYYRKILAITFTNKAAAEMKERVLEYLEVLSVGENKDGVLDWILKETELSEDQILSYAEKVKSSILHNYADLRISTIDKFTYNIVRTFSSDLGLAYNFELEMDNYKIIQPVVANLLSKMSAKGGNLSEALVNFALQKAEEGKSTNIENDLEDFSRNLFNEDAIPFLNSNTISISSCLKVKDDLIKKRNDIKKSISDLSDIISQYFVSFGFTKEHFLRGTFYNHFTENLKDEKKWTPSDSVQRNIQNDIWYTESKPDDIKDLVDTHKPKFLSYYYDLLSHIKEYNTVNSLFSNIYSIAVLNELLSEINEYKKEQNIEQISVFNKKIHEVIVKQPSSFIYERIGERYNHFLIDEFQDTSLLQWQNLLPLITDSVDYGSCFIVGDGKQSIYRWRGGEVEQFLNIPKIFMGDNLSEKSEWESKLEYHYNVDKGENQNYRSKKNIIDFNNKFFDKLKHNLSSSLIGIYDYSQQNFDFAKDGGYVHLELVDNEEDGFKENVIQKMISEIKILVSENNFRYKDITILCNSRKRVSLVANLFSISGIPVVSSEGLLINSSEKVRVIISVLRYLQNRTDKIAKASVCNFLINNSEKEYSIHEINLHISKKEEFNKILQNFNISLKERTLLRLPLYELIERLYKLFSIEEDVYTTFFLDIILSFSENKGSNIVEFLDWWEEKKEIESVVVPEETDAVQLMTIHKSKGLAFNVVMIPFNWEGGKNYSEIWVDSSPQTRNKLKSSLIRTTTKLENSDFDKEYLKEKQLSYMDNLNKLYVSMTRAKERLYIYSKQYSQNISKSFLNSTKLNLFLYQFGLQDKLVIGDSSEKFIRKENKSPNEYLLSGKMKIDWNKVVALKRSSERSWDLDDNNSAKDWGKLLHYALSLLNNKNEIIKCCNRVYLEGECDVELKEKLINTISDLFEKEEFNRFFDDRWEVKNEKEILLPSGESYIPDRILFDKNSTIVIDYKTGAPEQKYIDQIINYAFILNKMGYQNIEKYLIYTNSEKLVHKI